MSKNMSKNIQPGPLISSVHELRINHKSVYVYWDPNGDLTRHRITRKGGIVEVVCNHAKLDKDIIRKQVKVVLSDDTLSRMLSSKVPQIVVLNKHTKFY